MYKITLHKKVLSEDLEGLDKAEVEKIFKAVKGKLGTDPIHFGKPLKEELKGYYRLRVDFYRVVYQVKKHEVTVFVLKIGKRKDDEVYNEAVKRLS